MKCYHCEHYDNKTGICECDGKVVISPESDAECDYLKEPPTVFEKIIASKEALAEAVVYPDWAEYMGGDCWTSPFVGCYHTKPEAIAATLKELEEVAE